LKLRIFAHSCLFCADLSLLRRSAFRGIILA
jgi:hypothetical protein